MTNAAYANAGAITTEESRFKFSNSRIMTSEILLSSDDQKKIYDAFEQREYLAFPMVQIFGQQIDINSAAVSQDIGTSGSRVQKTKLVFQNHADTPYKVPSTNAATIASQTLGMKESNLIHSISGAVANANSKYLAGGGKSISFLPKISSLYTEIAGAKFPSADSLADLGTDLQKAYAIYSAQHKDDYEILPLEDAIYRYYDIDISYDGAENLFIGAVGEQGVDTSMNQLKLQMKLPFAPVNGALKCFAFNVVPTVIQATAKTISVLM